MIGISLAILSAATSAFAVVLVRKYSNQSSTFNISLVISLVGTLVLWPLALIFTSFSSVNILSLLIFGISGILTPGFVRLLYYAGLKRLGAPVNSSIFAIYPLYTSLLSIFFLGEILSPNNWVGILFVFLGAFLVEWSSRAPSNGKPISKKDFMYPLVGGVFLGLGSILRKYALTLYDAPVFGVALAYTFSLLPFILMIVMSKSIRKDISLKRDLRLFWGAGIGQAVTWMLAFYALSYTEVSIVTPLLSTEPIFIVLFAYFYLRKLEWVSLKLTLSVILTVAGIILVTVKI